MKEIVKDLEQAIFGYNNNDESLIEGLDKDILKKEGLDRMFKKRRESLIEGLDKDILEEEELDRRLKNLISKKRGESLREYLKESKDANPQDKVNALKEYLKNQKMPILKTKKKH